MRYLSFHLESYEKVCVNLVGVRRAPEEAKPAAVTSGLEVRKDTSKGGSDGVVRETEMAWQRRVAVRLQ